MKILTSNSLLPLALIFTFTSCQSLNSSTQPGFTPIRPDPTSTTTVSSTGNVPASKPTSVVSDQVAIETHTHPSNRFLINYPANWEVFNRPDGVIFIDPSDQAGYSVVFSDVGEIYSDEELNQYLVTFVAQNFADEEAGFSATSQEQKDDGLILAQFESIDPNLGPAISEVRVLQQDSIVFVLLISVTKEQWQVSSRELQKLADSFTPLDTSPIVEVEPTNEPPVWVLIGSTSNEFGFLYPSDWEILYQDESLVIVGMVDSDITFEGRVLDWPDANEDAMIAAEEAALALVDTLAEEFSTVQNTPPTEFALDTITGTTIDFLYSRKDGTEMAGSVITVGSKGKVYLVSFIAPADLYEGALQWFNPMYKSFKILSPEELR